MQDKATTPVVNWYIHDRANLYRWWLWVEDGQKISSHILLNLRWNQEQSCNTEKHIQLEYWSRLYLNLFISFLCNKNNFYLSESNATSLMQEDPVTYGPWNQNWLRRRRSKKSLGCIWSAKIWRTGQHKNTSSTFDFKRDYWTSKNQWWSIRQMPLYF